MPETFDLDARFADLEREIGVLTHAPGAAAAVRTSRRRRQTRMASVAAAAILCAGAGVAVLQDHHDSSPEPVSRPLPTPAPLSAQGLDDATRGWTGTWQPYDAGNRDDLRNQVNIGCNFLVQDQTVAQATRIGSGLLLTTDASQAVEYRMGIRGTEAAAQEYDATLAAFDACPDRDEQPFSYSDGADATVAALPGAGAQGGEVVVVATRYADRAGILLLGRVDSVPTTAQSAALADLALAATMDDATYSEPGPRSVTPLKPTREKPADTAGDVWPQTLAPALAGWSTPWHPQLPHDASQAVPDLSLPACAGDPVGKDPGNGMTKNVGRDGFQLMHWFASEAAAVQAVAGIEQGLASCATPYAVHTVQLPSGRPVVVAVGPHVVLWFTRVASHVLVLQLPAGATAPSDAVSVKVGQVLEAVLERPAVTTFPPGDRSTTPKWLKRAIAAAPTYGP